jgi:hypothetical protein
MQMFGEEHDTAVNSQVEAPATVGVVSCSQLACAACAVTSSPPAVTARVTQARAILRPGASLRRRECGLIVPVMRDTTISSRNDQKSAVMDRTRSITTIPGLPALLVHDLVEGAAVRLHDRLQRTVSREPIPSR